jgi:hypothetical protein
MSVAISMGQSERVAQYEVPDDELAIGSTLGSPTAVCILKASGALEKVYSTDIGETLFGSLTWRAYDEQTGMHLSRQAGGKFLIHPEHQEHRYTLDGDIGVHEDVFVHSSEPGKDGSVDPPGVYYCVTLTNSGSEPISLAVYAYTELLGKTEKDIISEYDEKLKAFVAWNEGKPDQVRLFGCTEKPDTFEVTQNMAKSVSRHCPGPLSNKIENVMHPLATMHHRVLLKPGKSASLHYLLSFGKGRAEAVNNYKACPPADEALNRTRSFYHEVLKRAMVFSPNEEVNRGVLWAKVNMLRVLIKAPTGWCFVNDPTRSNNSVGRDTAWFGYGADYFKSDFARESLLAYVRNQEKNGLIVEYYDIRTDKTDDYGLNINDNTPLLILALWHHYNTTGDKTFLQEVYGAAVKAGNRILSQRNAQGLVWCTATGTSDYGIIGWRNVITNYQLSGATTEVNSECYAALKTLMHMGRILGHHDESAKFAEEAEALRTAINTHLKNPENGFYYLSIDENGQPRSDITSDLVFPVMYEVADSDTSAAIISRLSDQDFWTTVGIRTTPRDAPNYDPNGGTDGPYGLLGGVWVGVSFWYAFAAARFNPDYMAHALSDSFKNYSADPRRNNTVPGQFSEWLHGETLVNEGMMLSPWFPPRYLWAAIEGAAGLDLSGDEIDLNPRLPSDWKWLGVRSLPYRGKMLAWLALRMPDLQIYTTFHLQKSQAYRAYEEDITDQIRTRGAEVCTFGLRQDTDLLLFVGSTSAETITTSIRVEFPLSGAYRVRRYDSLLSEWRDLGRRTAEEIQKGHVVQIEQRGFNLLELTQEV